MRRHCPSRRAARAIPAALLLATGTAAAQTDAAAPDPRVGLGSGWWDAKEAARGLALVGHGRKPEGFYNPQQSGDFGYLNSDLAFSGTTLFQGNFHGVQMWDIGDPTHPTLKATLPCPGGQGDVSVYKNLMFMSVEETRGRVDCGAQGVTDTVSAARFRGVRIFDITDVAHPKQIAAVQTCRGSHTHTLLESPADKANLYVYVSGTAGVRSPNELAGCSRGAPDADTTTSLFRIDVIRVPLAAPQTAKVVNSPRIFADAKTGNIAGLFKGGSQGEGNQSAGQTNQCHDITVYPALGLAAGACSGNGIVLDIRDPARPKRTADVSDPNFAYWHSATFSNDGQKVLFTDEWGGGTQPRCRTTDRPRWGADAIFTRNTSGAMTLAGYYKIPAPQTATENCVAHNGGLVPVPGRDIMVQGWYQGGVSVFDFSDPKNPQEIAFFDRGPMDTTKLQIGGAWGAYWYNGHVYSSEIGRGLDVLDLVPTALLSQHEIDAAKLIVARVSNPQEQQRVVWPASFAVSRAYLDQLGRNDGLAESRRTAIAAELDRVEKLGGTSRRTALTQLAARVDRDVSGAGDAPKVRMLAASVRKLAGG